MKEQFFTYLSQFGDSRLIMSFLLLLSLWIIRQFLIKKIRKSSVKRSYKRKWFVYVRNWSTSIAVIGIVVIWATELQTFALSVVAITAALIISAKELLLCVHGSFLRSFNNLYKIGDRIEIDNIRGNVIDFNLFVTKVLEIGPSNYTHQFTGRAITIPNSILLTKEVINESFLDEYVLHVFKVNFPRNIDWQKAEKDMNEAAMEECSEFIDKAQENMNQLSIQEGLSVPNANPRITYKFSNANEIEMIVRVPAPANHKGRVEQKILKQFMKKFLVKTEQ